jgi:hypothetical protein
MKKLMLSVALVAMSALAWALPSLQEVEAQVNQGHYVQAESMMKEVVAAKPNSARAHYIYAEILAHDGNVSRAADEARLARQIDPDLRFTTPEKFTAFEASLARAQSPAPRISATPSATTTIAPAAMAPAPASSGIPSWVWLAGLAAAAFFLWRGFSRSSAAAAGGAMAAPGATYGGTAVAPNAMAPGAMPYGAGYPAQRPSSGLLGVGLGVAGGVAAGMLADELLHRNRDGNVDHGGNVQPGFFDSPSSGAAGNDLADRPIDFGTGGSDWDSGSVDVGGGGGSDSGGSWD